MQYSLFGIPKPIDNLIDVENFVGQDINGQNHSDTLNGF